MPVRLTNTNKDKKESLSTGAIVGITIGSVVCFVVLLFMGYKLYKMLQRSSIEDIVLKDECKNHQDCPGENKCYNGTCYNPDNWNSLMRSHYAQ